MQILSHADLEATFDGPMPTGALSAAKRAGPPTLEQRAATFRHAAGVVRLCIRHLWDARRSGDAVAIFHARRDLDGAWNVCWYAKDELRIARRVAAVWPMAVRRAVVTRG